MADIWTMGEILVEIMRPESGMQLFNTGPFLGPFPSGAPAIFIDTAARLGHTAGIIGGVGRDDFGRCLIDRLRSDGVNCNYVAESATGSTAVAFVTYFADGSRKFIYHIDGTPAVGTSFPEPAADENPKYFHVMGCSLMANEGFRLEITKAAQAFHNRGAKVSFDPNIRPELLGERDIQEVAGPILDLCAVLLPGESELRLIADEKNLGHAAEKLFENKVLETIVLKRGKQGAQIYSRTEIVDTPAYPVQEIDPTGAGDCFDAGFLCGLLEGQSFEVCGKIAAATGALNAAAFGPMEGHISPTSVQKMIQGDIQEDSLGILWQ